jgi:hypothetical protein
MKKTLFILSALVLITGLPLFAQENNDKAKEDFNDYLILNFNSNQFVDIPSAVKVSPLSRGFNMKLMYAFAINESNFSFAFGGGLRTFNLYSNAYISESVEVIDSLNVLVSDLTPYSGETSYKINKINFTYFDIPLEIRYKIQPGKKKYPFKIAAGFNFSYHVQTHSKLVDNTGKYKMYNYNNLNKWIYGINLRFSYGKVGINGYYSLVSPFVKDRGPQFKFLSIGLTLQPF